MTPPVRLKEDYTLAKCCSPAPPADIVGYYSYENVLKVHLAGCPNLEKAEPDRLVTLCWNDVLDQSEEFTPDQDYEDLDSSDFTVLSHHDRYGVDYSHVVARKTGLTREAAFAAHRKLRSLGLLARVKPLIIQYRKGIVDNKWIKHRNHTYYELTDKGRAYLEYHRRRGQS